VLTFLADENFNRHIIRTLRREHPAVDVPRVQEVGLYGRDDVTILAWAAVAGRLLLTHDAATVTKYAYERTAAGLPMPGVVEVSRRLPVRQAVEEIVLIASCSRDGEWEGQVIYVPLPGP
jgi:hypothetical protein